MYHVWGLRGIHHPPAGRLLMRHGQVTLAHTLVKFQRVGIQTIPFAAAGSPPAQADCGVHVQQEGQVGAQAAGGKVEQQAEQRQINAMPVTLIGQGRVGVAV